jgi:cytochrome c556
MRGRDWLIGLVALGAASAAIASEGELEYREHTMEAIGGHMQAAVDILRQKVPHASHMTIHADALAALSGIVGTLFPEGSEGGDALPAIWEEPEDFAERVEAMREAATAFSAAARSNDDAALGQAFQALGQACKGCHDNYRAD